MKKLSIIILSVVLLTAVLIPLAKAEDKQVIPYPDGYVTTEEGASAYAGIGNVKNSPYYKQPDFYNLKSNKNLTLLSHYKTYQQTTEITCGPAAALTVLYHFKNAAWDEKSIAKIMGTKERVGTDTEGMSRFFKQLGWQVESSLDNKPFASPGEFLKFVSDNLHNNIPIMVENIDWGGHWRVIIGYDTMGTETTADDVLIMADSYDTADQKQDGYIINPAEKFFYMWFDAHMLPEGQQEQPWLTAYPKK